MIQIKRWSLQMLLFAVSVVWIGCWDFHHPFGASDFGDGRHNTHFRAEKSFSIEMNVTTQTRLRVTAINGSVTIRGSGSAGSVVIYGVRRVGSESVADAEEHLHELVANVENMGSEILVETIQPRDSRGRNYEVIYTITVPGDFAVSVDNVNGAVDIRDVFGGAQVELVNGRIDGRLGISDSGTIDMTTTNGAINLDIPSETSASFAANVVNGNISLSDLDLSGETRTRNSLQGTLGGGRGVVSLRVVNGNIRVSGY